MILDTTLLLLSPSELCFVLGPKDLFLDVNISRGPGSKTGSLSEAVFCLCWTISRSVAKDRGETQVGVTATLAALAFAHLCSVQVCLSQSHSFASGLKRNENTHTYTLLLLLFPFFSPTSGERGKDFRNPFRLKGEKKNWCKGEKTGDNYSYAFTVRETTEAKSEFQPFPLDVDSQIQSSRPDSRLTSNCCP